MTQNTPTDSFIEEKVRLFNEEFGDCQDYDPETFTDFLRSSLTEQKEKFRKMLLKKREDFIECDEDTPTFNALGDIIQSLDKEECLHQIVVGAGSGYGYNFDCKECGKKNIFKREDKEGGTFIS